MEPQKTWEDIAEHVSREQDPQRLVEMTKELLDALDSQQLSPEEQSDEARKKAA